MPTSQFQFADDLLRAIRSVETLPELTSLMETITKSLGFRHYALIHHGSPEALGPCRIDIKDYPSAVEDRLFKQNQFRRDPIIRACLFADGAFLWSEINRLITFNRYDRDALAFGRSMGLEEGITVPCTSLSDCVGSCTFAGKTTQTHAWTRIGVAQVIGIFAFQAARRLVAPPRYLAPSPRLHPRPRECVMLAGRGLSNKEIARQLGITPRTVDCYLSEARRLFGAHDRTELVVSAVLAGEVGLDELRRQPG